jgi:hypothetical protein
MRTLPDKKTEEKYLAAIYTHDAIRNPIKLFMLQTKKPYVLAFVLSSSLSALYSNFYASDFFTNFFTSIFYQ